MRFSQGLAVALLLTAAHPPSHRAVPANSAYCGVDWDAASSLLRSEPAARREEIDPRSVPAGGKGRLLAGQSSIPGEPRKEPKDPRRRRFFRSPAGTIVLVVVGAAVVGYVVLSSLEDE